MNKKLLPIIGLIAVALILIASRAMVNKEASTTADASQPTPVVEASTKPELPSGAMMAPSTASPAATVVTVDGQAINVETGYVSPGGPEKVGFNLVVDAKGVITSAEVKVEGVNPTTIMRQTKFGEEFPTVVIGKKLKDLASLDRVGGSSLTTGAFNKALPAVQEKLPS